MSIHQSTNEKEQQDLSSDVNASDERVQRMDILLKNRGNWWAIAAAVTALTVITAAVTSLAIIYSFGMSRTEENPPSDRGAALPPTSTEPVVEAVAASGYIEPEGEVISISAPAFVEGARVEQLLVKRGDKVEIGDLVAILDSRDRLEAALKLAQEQVKVAEASLARVKAGAKQGAIEAQEATIERLKAELQGQKVAREATVASLESRLQGEREAQAATIERLRAQLKNAATECRRYQNLYQGGAVSASLYESTCLEEETIREQLQEASAILFRIVNTLPKDINEAKANLSRTVTTLEKQILEAEARLAEIAEVRTVDVALAAAELSRAIAAVSQAQANLDLAYVKTPRSGQILKIHSWPGELVGDRGIVELGQTDQMYAVAEVYETDIGKIRLGDRAIVTSDGFSGQIKGTVSEIALQIGKKDVLGTDPAADVDARVVEVKIRLEDSDKVAGLTNLQINAIIDVSSGKE